MPITSTSLPPLCPGLVTFTTDLPIGYQGFVWIINGIEFISTENSIEYLIPEGITQVDVGVIDDAGNSQSATFSVASLRIEGPEGVCSGEQISLEAVVTPIDVTQDCLWSTGETTQSIIVTEPGTYTVQVTINGVCTITESHTVTFRTDCVTTEAPILNPTTTMETTKIYDWTISSSSTSIEIDFEA